MFENDDIIAAQATPPGESALSVIRMSGKGALDLWKKCIGKKNKKIEPRRASVSEFSAEGYLIDQVVYVYFENPESYTGEDLIEISCHGSIYIVRKILTELFRLGARPADPGEFTFRAFLNGKIDLTGAEAVADLIACDSEKARLNALMQLNGGLRQSIDSFREILLSLLADLEVELEFPDEEFLDLDYPKFKAQLTGLKNDIQNVIDRGHAGKAVREGFRVTIAGPPNSGKSTLLNALLGENRAIVHETAGTTRDILREYTEIGGVKVWLTDTAGLRQSGDEIESEGIRRAEKEIETSDLILYLFDLSDGMDKSEINKLPVDRLLTIGSKLDLYEEQQIDCRLKISAVRGDNLDTLQSIISERAFSRNIEGGIIANERHIESMSDAVEAIERALEIVADKGETELIAFELNHSAKVLGEVIGEGVTEEVLENIFSRFCIGK